MIQPPPTLHFTAALASAIDQLVDAGRNPSHDELTHVFVRASVETADPSAQASVSGR